MVVITLYGDEIMTRAVTETLTRADSTVVVVVPKRAYREVEYKITPTEIVDYEPVVLEEVNYTDWRGLAQSYRWRAGFELNKKFLIYRKIPGGDYHHKRKQRIQKMRHVWK